MRPAVLIALAASLALTGCQTALSPDQTSALALRGSCGREAGSWRLIATPADAATLKVLAKSGFPNAPAVWAEEAWFANSAGQLMLCVANRPFLHACLGEWWIFDRRLGALTVVDTEGWICVT